MIILLFFKYENNWKMVDIYFLREIVSKFFLGDLSQICLSTHPSQGLCEIWENKRWNSGKKEAIFGVIWFFWGVWTLFGNQPPHPPTFGKTFPKNNKLFSWRLPLMWHNCETPNVTYLQTFWNLKSSCRHFPATVNTKTTPTGLPNELRFDTSNVSDT